jgi:hypothetical protein
VLAQGWCQQLLLRCSSSSKGSSFRWVQRLVQLLLRAAARLGCCSANSSSRELCQQRLSQLMLLLVLQQTKGLLAVLMLLCWKCHRQ